MAECPLWTGSSNENDWKPTATLDCPHWCRYFAKQTLSSVFGPLIQQRSLWYMCTSNKEHFGKRWHHSLLCQSLVLLWLMNNTYWPGTLAWAFVFRFLCSRQDGYILFFKRSCGGRFYFYIEFIYPFISSSNGATDLNTTYKWHWQNPCQCWFQNSRNAIAHVSSGEKRQTALK